MSIVWKGKEAHDVNKRPRITWGHTTTFCDLFSGSAYIDVCVYVLYDSGDQSRFDKTCFAQYMPNETHIIDARTHQKSDTCK